MPLGHRKMNQIPSAWGDPTGQKEAMLAPKATGLGKAHWSKAVLEQWVQRTDISHADSRSSLSSQESQLLIPWIICQAVTCIHLQQHQGLASTVYSIPSPLEGLCSEIRLNEILQASIVESLKNAPLDPKFRLWKCLKKCLGSMLRFKITIHNRNSLGVGIDWNLNHQM